MLDPSALSILSAIATGGAIAEVPDILREMKLVRVGTYSVAGRPGFVSTCWYVTKEGRKALARAEGGETK